GHGGVVHVPPVAVLLHAEDAVVVADRADRDVDPLLPRAEPVDDAGCGRGHEASPHGRASCAAGSMPFRSTRRTCRGSPGHVHALVDIWGSGPPIGALRPKPPL